MCICGCCVCGCEVACYSRLLLENSEAFFRRSFCSREGVQGSVQLSQVSIKTNKQLPPYLQTPSIQPPISVSLPPSLPTSPSHTPSLTHTASLNPPPQGSLPSPFWSSPPTSLQKGPSPLQVPSISQSLLAWRGATSLITPRVPSSLGALPLCFLRTI